MRKVTGQRCRRPVLPGAAMPETIAASMRPSFRWRPATGCHQSHSPADLISSLSFSVVPASVFSFEVVLRRSSLESKRGQFSVVIKAITYVHPGVDLGLGHGSFRHGLYSPTHNAYLVFIYIYICNALVGVISALVGHLWLRGKDSHRSPP